MLQLTNLTLRRGAKELLRGANLSVHAGQKVGIVGANGTGKSSLFGLIRGELETDTGSVTTPRDWQVAWMAQEVPGLEQRAIDYVLDGDAELRRLEAELAEAEAAGEGSRLGELHGRLNAIDGYTAHARAARLLNGLGFNPGEEERPVAAFSGGWRIRLNLARTLMARADLLLLDEPTNHLDLDAVLRLQEWLAAYPGTVMLISHDRDFLDAVVGYIAHFRGCDLRLYKGGYSDFEAQYAEEQAQQQAAYEKQQKEIARIQRFVDRFRAQASKARQAQSRLKALERMEQVAPAHGEDPFQFSFLEPARLPQPLLGLKKVSAGYGDEPILSGVNLELYPGDRIGLLGPNGAGKSTLIRLLSGELDPGQGSRDPNQGLAVGYFAQHQVDHLDPAASPMKHLERLDPSAKPQQLRDFLGGFGFSGDLALSPVEPLSGGEKARLALALLVYRRPNLLLLDEGLAIVNDTFGGAVRFYDLAEGTLQRTIDLTDYHWVRELIRWTIPPYLAKELARKVGLRNHSVAKPLFVRGLVRDGSHLFVGVSPAAILQIDWQTGDLIDAYQYAEDVHVCVHGLEVLG